MSTKKQTADRHDRPDRPSTHVVPSLCSCIRLLLILPTLSRANAAPPAGGGGRRRLRRGGALEPRQVRAGRPQAEGRRRRRHRAGPRTRFDPSRRWVPCRGGSKAIPRRCSRRRWPCPGTTARGPRRCASVAPRLGSPQISRRRRRAGQGGRGNEARPMRRRRSAASAQRTPPKVQPRSHTTPVSDEGTRREN